MKSSVLFNLILFFTSVLVLKGQITHPEMHFLGKTPTWQYVTKDDNFVQSAGDKWSTPYSHRNILRLDVMDNHAFIFEPVFGQSYYGGDFGFLLHKIDLRTGAPDWIYHNNYDSGLTHRESYFSNLIQYGQDQVQITGLKAFEPVNVLFLQTSFYGKPVQKTIHLHTGDLVEEKESTVLQLKQPYNVTGYGNFCRYRYRNNQLFQYLAQVYIENDTLKNAIEVRPVDDNMNFDTINYTKLVHNTGLRTQLRELAYRPVFDFLHDSTLVALFANTDPGNLAQSPSDAWLSWIDISPDGSLKTTKEISIREDMYFPQDQRNRFYSVVKNENIIVTQLMNPVVSPVGSNYFMWLLWLDKDGNKKAKIDYLQTNNRYYSNLEIISVTDDKLLLAAYFGDAQKKGYDVLLIEAGANEAIRLGELHIANKPGEKLLLQRAAVTQDSALIVCFRTEVPYLGAFTSFNYVFRFESDILKKAFVTSVVDENTYHSAIKLAPNPATTTVHISMPDEVSTGTIHVADHTGRKVLTLAGVTDGSVMDISSLRPGMYLVSLTDSSGHPIGQVQKLVKIHE
jgi:hypothetical protein